MKQRIQSNKKKNNIAASLYTILLLGGIASNVVFASIANPGFESSWSGWNDIDPSAISGVAYSESKSAKITGPGGKFEQDVNVSPDTDYIVSAWVNGKGTIGVLVGNNDFNENGSYGNWTQISVPFNSGSSSTVTIYGKYNGGTGRFDNFSLSESGNVKLTVASVVASTDDGNVASNTLDNNLSTRWSADGNGQYITFNLGSLKSVSALKIAWYKGDERTAGFDVLVGSSTADLIQVHSGFSSGSTLELQTYEFSDTDAQYVRIIGYGNSASSWNSITEVVVWGSESDLEPYLTPTDIIPGLTKWKLTLPVDENGNDSSGVTDVDNRNTNPWEILDNGLIGFEYSPYFRAENGEVIFRAHCAGATTSGSYYPRSELRQRVGGGDNYWSMNDYQFLQTTFNITQVPIEKPEISMVQIHGPSDEPLRVQYHTDIGVYIIWNESNKDTQNALPYELGDSLQVTVTVENGDITTKIENLSKDTSYTKTWTSNDATGYFKVGCYAQSSIFLSQFKDGYNDEPLSAYCEMGVSGITLVETY